MMCISEFTTMGGVLSIALFDEVQPVVTPDFPQSASQSSNFVDDLANTIAGAIGQDLPQPKPKLMGDQFSIMADAIGPDLPQPKPK